MRELLDEHLALHPNVGEIRQCGLIAGIDVVQEGGKRYAWHLETGHQVCVEARRHGLLTRPIRDTLVLMPPLCIDDEQLQQAVLALRQAIDSVCGS
jgi:adenosylmethionine-8-amino-7-oxononanoate aminotransferase